MCFLKSIIYLCLKLQMFLNTPKEQDKKEHQYKHFCVINNSEKLTGQHLHYYWWSNVREKWLRTADNFSRKQAWMRTEIKSSSGYSTISHMGLFQASLALFGKERTTKKLSLSPPPKQTNKSLQFFLITTWERLYLEAFITSISSYLFFLAFELGIVGFILEKKKSLFW